MSNFIYDFVHSLTMREKAYFKRFTEMYSTKNKNYKLLYNYIEKSKDFTMKGLKEHFKDRSFNRYLSSELNYLLDQLLKSLVNFNFNSNPAFKLHKEILFINILMEKGYNKKAIKVLRAAKKTAYKYEDLSVILGLIQQEEEILFHEGILGFTDKLVELQKEREKVSAQISNLNALRMLREQIREFQFSVGFVYDTSKYPSIFNHPLLKSKDEALSKRALEHWYYVIVFRFYLTRKHAKSSEVSEEYLNFVENNLHIFKDSVLLPLLSNYLYACLLSVDYSTFSIVLKKLEALIDDPKLDNVYINYIRYSRIMDMKFDSSSRYSTASLMPEITVYANENLDELTDVQAEYFLRLLTRHCVLNENFTGALKWINKLFGSRLVNDTLDQTRIYSLIIYFELGWYEKLDIELKTAKKVLKEHKMFTELASSFNRFFTDYIKNPDQIEQQFLLLEKELYRISIDKKQNFPFQHFDYLEWCKTYKSKHQLA